jgi:predicted protein tyrosine phosphatase
MRKKVLCVCAKGLSRSKYLASYLRNKGYSTRWGGVEGMNKRGKAPNHLTQEDIEWADLVIITRKRIRPKFDKQFKNRKNKIQLDVVDDGTMRANMRKAIKPYLPL